MKKSTAVTAGVAALALIGGGTAYALSSADEPAPVETPAAISTENPAPSESATPEPVATTPVAEASEEPAPAPTSPEGDYSDAEAFLIEVTQRDMPEFAFTAEEILEAAAAVCATPNAGPVVPTEAFAGASEDQIVQFRVNAEYHVCG